MAGTPRRTDPGSERGVSADGAGRRPLSDRARALAGAMRVGGRGLTPLLLRRRLRLLREQLSSTERLLEGEPSWPAEATDATEWLLDNEFVVNAALSHVREVLSAGFLRQLPKLADGPLAGEPRIYAVARELVPEGDADVDRARAFVRAFRPTPALTMGEIWALPAILRLVLLEGLAATAASLPRAPGGAADRAWRTLWRSPPEAFPLDGVGTCIKSLRALAAVDWKAFVESVSRTHAVLCRDPAGVYAGMDFETRERYRKAVELLARRSAAEEEAVARLVVRLCRHAAGDDPRLRHVGYYLVDRGRADLERRLGRARRVRDVVSPILGGHGAALYVASTVALAAGLLGLFIHALGAAVGGPATVLLTLLGVVPAVSLAVALINWLVSHSRSPRILPKLALRDGIGDERPTAVVVPALVSGPADVAALLRQLELNYHGNRDPDIRFALLADFTDAGARDAPGDAELLRALEDGVQALNQRYGGATGGPFHLLFRERQWNPREACWMGWERKRGKLAELNRLILGRETGLRVCVGDAAALRGIRFVVTLDADTLLPSGAARRLVGALDHPLNRPRFDDGGRVVAGYTIVEPRVEIFPASADESGFARVFAGERGLDLYTHAVSDVYQDLFGEGIFAGKGIYNVAAFERSMAGRVPDDALLSHDLFEGLCGRAALASDIVAFESFPGHVLGYMGRLHRWVRGDWQLLPWLLPRVPSSSGRRIRSWVGVLGWWKIADNLRRSLFAPALLALLGAGWLAAPAVAGRVSIAAILVLAAPVILSAGTAGRHWAGARWRRLVSLHPAGALHLSVQRMLTALLLLPFQAAVEADAMTRTLARLARHRHLLQWTPAAHAGRALRQVGGAAQAYRHMAIAPLLALALGWGILLVHAGTLALAGPFLVAWLASPLLALWLSTPRAREDRPLEAADRHLLRGLARRTWGFFDRVIGPEDHWLPPDHMQEEPGEARAHRTSPTNTGLLMTSAVVAYDLGYAPLTRLAALLDSVLDTLAEMERYRGHFLNWYDTHNLTALEPRYVSTVDSGNLAVCLLVVSAACAEAEGAPVPSRALVAGLRDTVQVLSELIEELGLPASAPAPLLAQLDAMESGMGGQPTARVWARRLEALAREAIPAFEGALLSAVEAQLGRLDAKRVAELRRWVRMLVKQVEAQRSELALLRPCLALPNAPPAALGGEHADARVLEAWRRLLARANAPITVDGLEERTVELIGAADRLSEAVGAELPDSGGGADADARAAARDWLRTLGGTLLKAVHGARELRAELADVSARAAALVAEMDFSFLYDRDRDLFHIGFNVSAGQIDHSFYDLLASEARLASLVAIVKGDAPPRHWLHLGRPFRRTRSGAALLSWGGSMFEYLLPALFVRTPPASLLGHACAQAVLEQIRFSRQWKIPWGISESAYDEVNAHGTYQYRAFGVPALALRRGAGDRLVIAPYAAALALPVSPRAALENLRRLIRLGGRGAFGLYEALDFGPSGKWAPATAGRVSAYMAHHQGMILLALGEQLGSPVVDRLNSNPGVAALEFLLLEQAPSVGRLEPLPARRPAQVRPASAPPRITPWRLEEPVSGRHALVLSNGALSTLITGSGGGGIQWQGKALTRWAGGAAPDAHGVWIYLRDAVSGELWAPSAAPTLAGADHAEVSFAPHAAKFHYRRAGISSRLEIAVAPSAPVELRRLSLLNESGRRRRLLVTSCGEVVLAPAAEDRRHPAFSKNVHRRKAGGGRRNARLPPPYGPADGGDSPPGPHLCCDARRPAERLGDRSRALPRPQRDLPLTPGAVRRRFGRGHAGGTARPDLRADPRAHAAAGPGARADLPDRRGSLAAGGARVPGRVPDPRPDLVGLRSGAPAQCAGAARAGHRAGPGALPHSSPVGTRLSLPAARRKPSHRWCGCRSAGRPAGAVGARHLGRPAPPPAARASRGGGSAPHGAGRAGARVLAEGRRAGGSPDPG